MPKKIDLTNQKFNLLLVLQDSGKRSASGSILWECKCDCGNISFATGTDLKNGHKKSCGCLQKQQAQKIGHKNLIDLTGQIFGQLTVLNQESSQKTPNGSLKTMWKCQCKCGNEVIVAGQSLRNSNTTSCGCIKSRGEQKISEMLTKANIPFTKEYIFEDFKPYRYDFFVENKYVIEYDGKQHFEDFSWGDNEYRAEDIQKRDLLKNQYCWRRNIPIIRIPYTRYNELNIKDLLLETSNFIVKECKEQL